MALLDVGKDTCALVDVAGLHRLVELVVERAGLGGTVALQPLPAVEGGKSRQRNDDEPGDEAGVLLPEMLELVELLLFLKV